MSKLLTTKLSAVRRKRATVTTLTGVAAAVAAFVLLVGLTMVIDWWVELPYAARAAMLCVEAAVLAYILFWHVFRPIVRGPNDEDLALAVEQESPSFRSRLISSIQLLRFEPAALGVSPAMVSALVRETEEIAKPMDFAAVVKIDRLTTFGTIAAVVLIGFGAATAATAPESIALLQRAALMNVPVPRKTQVECLSRDLFVPRGEPVTLTAKASGLIIPDSGWVELEFASGASQRFSMDLQEGARDQYTRTIDNVQENFTYRVYLNDGRSAEHKVTAAIRPAVSGVDVHQKFPAYTGFKDPVKRPTGDLTILEGSRVMLDITANKIVKRTRGDERVRNYLHLHGVEQDFPLSVNSGDPTKLTVRDGQDAGILLPKGTTGFSVYLVDEHGLISKNPAVYPITLVPDQAPRISITAPKRNDELVTPMATVDIGFDASDDYGISQVLLRWRAVDPDGNIAGASGDGLEAVYYGNASFEKEVQRRVDGEIGFDWTASSGKRDPAVKMSNLSVRWAGQLQPAIGGSYTFTVESGASAKLWIDGKQVLDAKNKPASSQPMQLNAFQRYDVKLEYAASGAIGHIRLLWEAPGVERQIIPRSVLFSTPITDKTALVASGGVPERIIHLQIPPGNPNNKTARGYYPWKISELAADLQLGSVIQWRLETRDNNNVSGPGISFSDTRQLRLVSEADKRKELMDRMGETLTQIDQISDSQRDLRDRTAQIVTGKAIDRPIDLPPDIEKPKK